MTKLDDYAGSQSLVGICEKAKEHGYPHELWTTRLLARHARDNAPAAGHESLANLVQGTVCKILAQGEVKPHKVRYYLERRDAEFEQKMAEVLCVYREVQVLKKAAAKPNKPEKPVAISDEGMNLPGEQIDPGQQTERAMAFVLMITREGRVDAGYRRQIGRGCCDGLDSRFFVIGRSLPACPVSS